MLPKSPGTVHYFDTLFFSSVTREWKSNSEPVVILEDHSVNGTFVNKQQVGRGKRVVLKNNDEISLAHVNKKGVCLI